LAIDNDATRQHRPDTRQRVELLGRREIDVDLGAR
jgi:hypothetical protein